MTPDDPPKRTPTGLIQFVRRSGARLVLKVIAHDDEAAQAAALAQFSGDGAVRLVATDGPALLIERAIPGGDLVDLVRSGRDDQATAILAETMLSLHRLQPPGAGFRTIEDWGKGFDRARTRALAQGIDAVLIERGAAVYRELCESQGPRRLLHGDLQHYNVLFDANRGWLAIDPKGVIGEAAFDCAAMLRNPVGEPDLAADPAVMARRVAILAERCGLEARRILGWGFSGAVLSALWSVEDGQDPGLGLRVAHAALSLL
ncbi:MAG: aminoglycoside phosphotransferase family protein [Phenylobacterium sp.]